MPFLLYLMLFPSVDTAKTFHSISKQYKESDQIFVGSFGNMTTFLLRGLKTQSSWYSKRVEGQYPVMISLLGVVTSATNNT